MPILQEKGSTGNLVAILDRGYNQTPQVETRHHYSGTPQSQTRFSHQYGVDWSYLCLTPLNWACQTRKYRSEAL